MVFYNLPPTLKKIVLILCSVCFFNGSLLAGSCQNFSHDTTIDRLLQQPADEATQDFEYEEEESESESDSDSASSVYNLPPIELREVSAATIDSLKSLKEFAYANDSAYWKKARQPERETSGSGFALMQIGLYILLIIGAVYGIYSIIVSNKLHLFYSSGKNKKVATQESILTEANLDEKISESIATQEYRHAVRYMYLKSLRLLSDKGWIKLNANSTNIDYLNSMSKRAEGAPFKIITRNYEYVWYGEFDLTKEHFNVLQNKFNDFYNRLK